MTDDLSQRILIWFSAGAASAVAAKIALSESNGREVLIAYTDTGGEHPDNIRFIEDCRKWLNHDIEIFKSKKYEDIWDVWKKRRFLVNRNGALCTVEMKKKVRFRVEKPDDIQVFGYTKDEQSRADKFIKSNPDVNLWTPLIEKNLSKADCLAIIHKSGIEIPEMYKLGYKNNNCIGCVKGGIGYWNKIRVDFPETFDRMAKLEREIGSSVLRSRLVGQKTEKLFLDELDPDRGYYPAEIDFECSLLCSEVEQDLNESCDDD
jgi:hypothetical protein